jgi:HrpA-like RNA helicase
VSIDNLLATTLIGQNRDIFARIPERGVTLVCSDTGTGKSLVTPLKLCDYFGGDVLVLNPSTDTARDLAQRLANIMGWRIGFEIGLWADGVRHNGTHVTIATYGTYVYQRSLLEYSWAAIVFDECHAEGTDVELARSEIRAALAEGERIAVYELSATMELKHLQAYWEDVAPVWVHRIESPPSQLRKFVQSTLPIEQLVGERLSAGAQFVMVVRPGRSDVLATAENLRAQYAGSTTILTYHGDSDSPARIAALAPLGTTERRILVCTPRLITGFNHEDLDAIVTCGRIKSKELTQSGSEILRLVDMTQTELTQMLGRLGRFGNAGTLVLASETNFAERPIRPKAEVERICSLRLCLMLCGMGRDPQKVRFSSPPNDIKGSMRRLLLWGYIDQDAEITDLGKSALEMEIRLDLAHMVLQFERTPSAHAQVAALAVLSAAAVAAGKMEHPNNRGFLPVFTHDSDWVNEGLRLALALRMDRAELYSNGFNPRAVRRAIASVRTILRVLDNPAIEQFFNLPRTGDESRKATLDAWKAVGRAFENRLPIPGAIFEAIVETLRDRICTLDVFRGYTYVVPEDPYQDAIPLGNESSVRIRGRGDRYAVCATIKVIVPKNGNQPFTIATECTVLPPTVAESLGLPALNQAPTQPRSHLQLVS